MCLGKLSADIPLVGSKIETEIRNVTAKIRITQGWKNNRANDIEIKYLYSLPKGAYTCSFYADVEGKIIRGKLMEKNAAEEEYDDAVASGHGAFLVKQNSSYFEMWIGSLQAGKEVLVVLEYVIQLSFIENTISFVLPPKAKDLILLNESESEKSRFRDKFEDNQSSYSFKVEMHSRILSIDSQTHNIFVNKSSESEDGKLQCFTLNAEQAEAFCLEDLKIRFRLEEPFEPTYNIERNEKGDLSASISFHPDFTENQETFSEFIFLVDCSGSMYGDSIESVKRSLHFFLRSLPETCYFNIIDFGTNYRSLFRSSQKYDDKTLQLAVKNVERKNADMGGTNLLEPLKYVLENKVAKNGYSRQIFLLTDGAVENSMECLKIAMYKANDTRIFTFGVGPTADKNLIYSLAEITHGQSEFIVEESKCESSIMKQLLRAMRPAITDIKLVLEGEGSSKCKQSPYYHPNIFDGGQAIFYLRLEGKDIQEEKPKLNAKLSGKIGNHTFEQTVLLDFGKAKTYTKEEELISCLYGASIIKDLENGTSYLHNPQGGLKRNATEKMVKEEIISASLENGVLSSLTAFVGVEEREEAKVGTTELVNVNNRHIDGQIAEIREIMERNIERILYRNERLDSLLDKTNDLAASARQFRKSAATLSGYNIPNPFSSALDYISSWFKQSDEPFHQPTSHITEERLVDKLIKTQHAKGDFGRESLLLVGVDEETIKKALPNQIQVTDEVLAICISVLICAYLELKCKEDSVLWTLIVNKSRMWIKSEMKRLNLSESQFDGISAIVHK
eukprot:TRINITY_DN2829_c1_g2_i1.p1 TRINITY_DN2829_c1_g2~~TRINITY_DN2829_c1_g2_i1.p1  ORF type:complete len:835 (-),score=212.87 TRINITY_DN2829_c1_g2_i1:985-3354(-)